MLVNVGGHVSPPEEGLRLESSVIKADLELDIGLARMQADAMHALHAGHGIVVAAPDCDGTIWIALDGGFHRHESRGAMMLGPVELDASGNPRSGEADQSRFDDVLAIEKVVAVALVDTHMDAAADRRQDHQA